MTTANDKEVPAIVPIGPADFDWVLALNKRFETELSPLDAPELGQLCRESFYAAACGHAAFLLAFDQDAAYRSPNFLWFCDRYSRFVYVDRIAVAPESAGKGLARRLYGDLFAKARAAGHAIVVCEVNVDPPNPGSDAFHAKLGFSEIGRALLEERGKSVRYLSSQIRP